MKITDEMIKEAAVKRGFKLTNETEDDLKPYVYEFARELIALAQQVKPLVFVKRQFHVPVGPDAHLVADCITGKYLIHMVAYPVIAKMKYFFSGPEFGTHTNYYERKQFNTEAEAIAAANEDFQRRVLSCLVWGGCDDKYK